MSVNRRSKDSIIAELKRTIAHLEDVNRAQVNRLVDFEMVRAHRDELQTKVRGLQWEVKRLRTL